MSSVGLRRWNLHVFFFICGFISPHEAFVIKTRRTWCSAIKVIFVPRCSSSMASSFSLIHEHQKSVFGLGRQDHEQKERSARSGTPRLGS